MPNHVMNVLEFSGDAGKIKEMREKIKNDKFGLFPFGYYIKTSESILKTAAFHITADKSCFIKAAVSEICFAHIAVFKGSIRYRCFFSHCGLGVVGGYLLRSAAILFFTKYRRHATYQKAK